MAIKIPFLIEGSFIGLFGSIIPIIIMAYGYNTLYNYLGGQLFSSSLGKLVAPYPFILWTSLLLLLIFFRLQLTLSPISLILLRAIIFKSFINYHYFLILLFLLNSFDS